MKTSTSWWFPAWPRGRVAVLRTAVYLFVIADVVYVRAWVADHGEVPGGLYRPLFVGRLFDLPTPDEAFVGGVKIALLVAAVVALSGRMPRLAGWAVFLLYLQWQVIAFSYGKVDHDRFAFLVALAVLPSVGRARWGDRTPDERAGWAVRFVQVAVVATYVLAAVAKLRYSGIDWVNGATLVRAIVRRGTFLADPLLDHPEMLQVAQFFVVAFELSSPALLVRGWVGRWMLALAAAFHLITFGAITIIFLPHVLCLLAFLPLERVPAPAQVLGRQRSRGVRSLGPPKGTGSTAPPRWAEV